MGGVGGVWNRKVMKRGEMQKKIFDFRTDYHIFRCFDRKVKKKWIVTIKIRHFGLDDGQRFYCNACCMRIPSLPSKETRGAGKIDRHRLKLKMSRNLST